MKNEDEIEMQEGDGEYQGIHNFGIIVCTKPAGQ